MSLPELTPEAIETYRRTYQRRLHQQRQQREAHHLQALSAAVEAIKQVAPAYPGVARIFLFGSIVEPERFSQKSDIDVGIEGGDIALCFNIWRDLEKVAPAWQFDVRELTAGDPFSERVRQKGSVVYEQTDRS